MSEIAAQRRNFARQRFLSFTIPACAWASAAAVTAMFLWLLGDLVLHGLSALSLEFLTEYPRSAGRAGGIFPILVSTSIILAVAIAAATPLGIAAAIMLSEFAKEDGVFSRHIGLALDVLAGVPSIVFGLFGNAFFSLFLGFGFSLLSGGLTLACMILPILIRTAEQGLRAVPNEWRHGAAALGLSRSTAILRIVIPTAAPAIVAGLMLGIGRAAAETAALIYTSGYVSRMPGSLFDSGRALSVHIYDLAMNVAGGNERAYASALVLIALLVIVNSAALWFSGFTLRRIAVKT